FARPGFHHFWKKFAHLCKGRQHFDLFQKAFRRFHVEQVANALRNLVQLLHSQSHLHAMLGAKLIDEDWDSRRTLDLLKQQRRAPGTSLLPGRAFGNAVSDLRDLKNRITLRADALQLARRFQRGNPFSKVFVSFHLLFVLEFIPIPPFPYAQPYWLPSAQTARGLNIEDPGVPWANWANC